ncbi:MAG: hypothetical protein HUJ61_06500 [Bacilli bacterium]|nr:hypothetical protein [Bacilli bacterium]
MIVDKIKMTALNSADKSAVSISYLLSSNIVKTYEELYLDIFKMIDYLEYKGVQNGNRLLYIGDEETYEYLLFLFASMYRRYNIIFVDKHINNDEKKRIISFEKPSYIINNKAIDFKKLFSSLYQGIHSINCGYWFKGESIELPYGDSMCNIITSYQYDEECENQYCCHKMYIKDIEEEIRNLTEGVKCHYHINDKILKVLVALDNGTVGKL